MTDEELAQCCKQCREILGQFRRGTLHSWWDSIFDAEAIIRGKPSLLPRASVESFFRVLIKEGKIKGPEKC
jgi:hypothetical protein